MIKNKLLIVGMSPGNGYFKQEVIDKLLVYCLEKYKKIGVFIPDVPAISTYVALGYPENIAKSKKAIPQGNNFRNRIKKSIDEKNLNSNEIYVFDWQREKIQDSIDYQKAFTYVKNVYENNILFNQDINSETRKVLVNNSFRKKEITEDDIKIGSHYILSEFAFMLHLPEHLKTYDSFIYGYHNPWPVWEKFISGEYDNQKKNNLEFLLLPNFSQ